LHEARCVRERDEDVADRGSHTTVAIVERGKHALAAGDRGELLGIDGQGEPKRGVLSVSDEVDAGAGQRLRGRGALEDDGVGGEAVAFGRLDVRGGRRHRHILSEAVAEGVAGRTGCGVVEPPAAGGDVEAGVLGDAAAEVAGHVVPHVEG
jgi:hypothetical protein